MLFSVSMFPIGSGDSLSHPVAEVIDEIDRAGLTYQVSAMDTIIEGEWKDVMPVIRTAHRHLTERHDRVYVDDHESAESRLTGAVADVEEELGRPVPH
jgi:uncharacterized protein (TIGR00106 family)